MAYLLLKTKYEDYLLDVMWIGLIGLVTGVSGVEFFFWIQRFMILTKYISLPFN